MPEHELDMRLSKWFALFRRNDDADRHADSADASRNGTAKPLAATESKLVDDGSMTAASKPDRHDDGSFPFPQDLRRHRSNCDGAPLPSWWKHFFR